MGKVVDKPYLPTFAGLRVYLFLSFLLLLQYHPVFASITISTGVNNISKHFLVEIRIVKDVRVRSIRHVVTFLQGAYPTFFPS